MDKIAFIQKWHHKSAPEFTAGYFKALLECLSPEETCMLLDLNFSQDIYSRDKIIDKIKRDMQSHYRSCHSRLARSLLELVKVGMPRKRESAAKTICQLVPFLIEDLKNEITLFLINSHFLSLRNRAYQLMYNYWPLWSKKEIAKCWKSYRDFKCVDIILNKMPTFFIRRHFDEISEVLTAVSNTSKLFIKLKCSSGPRYSKLLREDPITATYVKTILGGKLKDRDAFTIYQRTKDDAKFPIIVWCFGKMRLWNVLYKICSAHQTSYKNDEGRNSNQPVHSDAPCGA